MPRPPTPREMKAIQAMEPLGLDAETVQRQFRKLRKLYGKGHLLIEQENYRALADYCFEQMEKPGSLEEEEEDVEEEEVLPRQLRRRSDPELLRNSQESYEAKLRAQHAQGQAEADAQARAQAQMQAELAQQAQAKAEVRARAHAQAQVQLQGQKQVLVEAPAQRRAESRFAQTGTQTELVRSTVSRAAQTQDRFEAGPSSCEIPHAEPLPPVSVKVEVCGRESGCTIEDKGQPRAASSTRTTDVGVVHQAMQYNGVAEKRKGLAVQPLVPMKKPKLEPGIAEWPTVKSVHPSSFPRASGANGSPAEVKRSVPHTGRPPLSPVQPSRSSDVLRRVHHAPSGVPVMRLQEAIAPKVKQEPPEPATIRSNGIARGSAGPDAAEAIQCSPLAADAAVQCVETEIDSDAGGNQQIGATDAAPEPMDFSIGPLGGAAAAAAAARDAPLEKVKIEDDSPIIEHSAMEAGRVEPTVACVGKAVAAPPSTTYRSLVPCQLVASIHMSLGDRREDGSAEDGVRVEKDRKGKGLLVDRCHPHASKILPRKNHDTDAVNGDFQLELGKKGRGLLVMEAAPQSVDSTSIENHEGGTDGGGFQHNMEDISCGYERVKIPCINASTSECLPTCFQYISTNIVHQNAYVMFNLERIEDDNHCGCMGDCLRNPMACHCSARTGGVYAYKEDGCLQEHFIDNHLKKVWGEDVPKPLVHCVRKSCPLEKDGNHPEKCRGHPSRPFIKECWVKCRCNKELCGNRVVQRGVTRRLQVFWTQEGKGWGIRTLEELPKGAFVFEYVGEILTNTELHMRNKKTSNDSHHYPITLDSDWVTEEILTDNEALCLDGTYYGNVARFLNHRCFDSNLMDMAVEIETPDHNYYHVAFFTTTRVKANEELTWDYGIDFDDLEHPVKAFVCKCGSQHCRDPNNKLAKDNSEIGLRL